MSSILLHKKVYRSNTEKPLPPPFTCTITCPILNEPSLASTRWASSRRACTLTHGSFTHSQWHCTPAVSVPMPSQPTSRDFKKCTLWCAWYVLLPRCHRDQRRPSASESTSTSSVNLIISFIILFHPAILVFLTSSLEYSQQLLQYPSQPLCTAAPLSSPSSVT